MWCLSGAPLVWFRNCKKLIGKSWKFAKIPTEPRLCSKLDYNEIVAANIAVTKLAQTLDKLVSDMQSLNAGNALQQSYENLLYQVGLIKCDMTSENRCKSLQAIRCAIQSTRQLLLLNKQKTRSKLSDELDAISESISMFGSDSDWRPLCSVSTSPWVRTRLAAEMDGRVAVDVLLLPRHLISNLLWSIFMHNIVHTYWLLYFHLLLRTPSYPRTHMYAVIQ